jgi:hypothetical protein
MNTRHTDPLVELEARLAGLDDAPVDEHPAALEGVHGRLVAELDALAGAGARPPEPHEE